MAERRINRGKFDRRRSEKWFTCSNEIDNPIPSYFLRGAYTIGGNGGITGRVVRNVLQTFLSILRVHGKRRIIHGVHRRNMLVGR